MGSTIIVMIALALALSQVGFVADATWNSVIAVTITVICIALYKIGIIGYLSKIVTSAAVIYWLEKYVYEWVDKRWISEQYSMVGKILFCIIGTALYSYWLIESTSINFLSTPGTNWDDIWIHLKWSRKFPYKSALFKKKNLKKEKIYCKKEDWERLKEANDKMQRNLEEYQERCKKLSIENARLQSQTNSLKILFASPNEEVRKTRYRKLCQIFHPDNHSTGSEEIFKILQDSYNS